MSNANSPRCEWVRDDQAEVMTRVLRQIKTEGEANPLTQHTGADTIYLTVERLNGREGTPTRYRARGISGHPSADTLEVRGWSVEECLVEVRHLLLEIYWAERSPADDRTSVRKRVTDTKFETFSVAGE